MDDERRVYYKITSLGQNALAAELERYREVVAVAKSNTLAPNTLRLWHMNLYCGMPALYAKLLRLYPKPYRERFGEGMEQTFNDLLRERVRTERGLFSIALWMFFETSAGIFRENVRFTTMPLTKIIRVLLVAAGLLIVPLTASFFVDGWNWGVGGYVFAWVMFASAGLGFTFVASMGNSIAYKVAVGIAVRGSVCPRLDKCRRWHHRRRSRELDVFGSDRRRIRRCLYRALPSAWNGAGALRDSGRSDVGPRDRARDLERRLARSAN